EFRSVRRTPEEPLFNSLLEQYHYLRYKQPVEIPHLASHLLARMTRMLSGEWERAYGHAIYFVETFIDSERYHGTCYRAANWMVLGHTTGRGKNAWSKRPNRPIKEVLGYPLRRDFRQLLSVKRCGRRRSRGSTYLWKSWKNCWSVRVRNGSMKRDTRSGNRL